MAACLLVGMAGMVRLQFPQGHRQWLECAAMAVLYVASAMPSHYFATGPAQAAPIWLPAGVALAAILIRGEFLWPGIFIGGVLADSGASPAFSSHGALLWHFVSAGAHGLGPVVSVLFAARIITRRVATADLLYNLKAFYQLVVYGAIFGPLASGLLGVGAHVLAGEIPVREAGVTLGTWWFGDSVGVLLLTPVILAFYYPQPKIVSRSGNTASPVEIVLFILIVAVLPFANVLLAPRMPLQLLAMYATIPIMIWSIAQLGERPTIFAFLYFSIVRLWLFVRGHGLFEASDGAVSLIVWQGFLAIALITAFSILTVLRQNQRLVAGLRERVVHDALTGAFNRSYMERQIQLAVDRNARYNTPFSVIMIDIDHFKQLNDSFGHSAGDKALIKLVQTISATTRDIDVLARWGGEEFMILMPETRVDSAGHYAERLRQQVAGAHIVPGHTLTISLGVVEYAPGQSTTQLYELVDRALYRAKETGRNRVCLPSGPLHPVTQ